MKISLIIPAKQEEESLPSVLHELKNYQNFINEIIVVLSSKRDKSISILKKYKCKILFQKKNGFGAAIKEGFKNCNTNYACIFNADYSFIPKYLPIMIKKLKKYDFVFGSRYLKNGGSEDDNLITLFGNKFFTFISYFFLKINLTDVLYTYVLCNVKKFNFLNLKRNDFRLCVELPTSIQKENYKYCEIPMLERKRIRGKKKVKVIKDGFLILMEILYSVLFK